MRASTLSKEEQQFSDCVVAHLKAFAGRIDVTRYVQRNAWSEDKVLDLFIDVLWNTPEIFYVSKRCRYEYKILDSGKITHASICGLRYGIERSQYNECKVRLDAAVKRAMQYIRGLRSPELVALKLHDFIVENCEYDLKAADQNDKSPLARTAYSVLVRGKAVCEGYTMAYRHLLNAAGIQCEEVCSDSMHHCWNYVKINGMWYHVDVTFDDPVYICCKADGRRELSVSSPDGNGIITHENFLMSDVQAQKTGHYGWRTRGLPPASDMRYDNRMW